MPLREWLCHATSVRGDPGQGKYQRWLTQDLNALSCSGEAVLCNHKALKQRAWSGTCLRGALYTALLSLSLLLTMMSGLPSAQTPSTGNEPAPTPAVLGPLETVPSPQERLLAPVPTQF